MIKLWIPAFKMHLSPSWSSIMNRVIIAVCWHNNPIVFWKWRLANRPWYKLIKELALLLFCANVSKKQSRTKLCLSHWSKAPPRDERPCGRSPGSCGLDAPVGEFGRGLGFMPDCRMHLILLSKVAADLHVSRQFCMFFCFSKCC